MEFKSFADPAFAPRNLLPSLLFTLDETKTDYTLLYQDAKSGALVLTAGEAPLRKALKGDQLAKFLKAKGADLDQPVHMLPQDLQFPALDASDGTADAAPDASVGPRAYAVPPARAAAQSAVSPVPPVPKVAEIGVLDAGIAFWNPAFWDQAQDQSRFASFSGLKMEVGQGIERVDLTKEELGGMAARGRLADGDRKNRAALAQKLPSSVFAQDPGARPLAPGQGLSHGTAMTEMILCTAPKGARLHGMELPRRALRDLSGAAMRSILNLALRELVAQVIAQRGDDAPFRMVILVAFGFVGGPKTAAQSLPDVVQSLQETITSYGQLGYDLEIVLPMGNHRQHQLHAVLPADDTLNWRIQPDDHSLNTVELFHQEPLEALRVTAPDGTTAEWEPRKGAVSLLRDKGRTLGALWTEALPCKTQWRSRLSLMPSAGRIAQRAPFGLWQLALPKASHPTEAWILRDETGYEPDPARPMRASWFEDPHYRHRDALGLPQMDDTGHGGTPQIRRAGTASVLTLGDISGLTTVEARWQDPATEASLVAPYSGAAAAGDNPEACSDLAEGVAHNMRPIGPFGRRAVLGNGGDNRFRVSGTSVAAALVAGELAGKLADPAAGPTA